METMNPGPAFFLVVLGLVASSAAGVYIRYRLRFHPFIQSGKCSAVLGSVSFMLIILMSSFAMDELYVPTAIAFFLFAVGFTTLVFDINPPWKE